MNFDDYERQGRLKYEAFAEALSKILEAAIRAEPAYRLQQIQNRAKDPTTLKSKLAKFEVPEGAAIEDHIKDLAGCRVIFYTNADVKRFLSSDILRNNFAIDWNRTKVHHPVPGTESEGSYFISDNIVVQLTEQRAALPEYAQFRGMRCEIQIQTTLNHAWSEMQHDVYKDKPAAGFGRDLQQDIQKRFDKIAREMLIPAGHEFQKIVHDYGRLVSGRELFDKGALKMLGECKDNNERYELLERFNAYLVPHLDDPAGAHAEIRGAIASTVQAVRATKPKPIATPWGDLPGKTAEDVVELATDILDHLRYVSIDAVMATLDTLCELYPGASSDGERSRIRKSVKSLASHNLAVWKVGGAVVQDMLVRRIRAWDPVTLEALRPVALTALEQVLQPEASGTSSTYKSITWSTAAVVPSDALTRIREISLDLLEELFRTAPGETERREVKQVLFDATRFPQAGANSPLRLTILRNSTRVANFFAGISDTLSHQLLQTLEDNFLWLYRHTRRPVDAPPEEADIAAARGALVDAIFAFRDLVNANRDFVVYKTLVGFESVFPPEWEGDPMDVEAENAYRNARIGELVGEVNGANADAWLKILQRCASTRSDDSATFPSFGQFLEQLGRSKPEIVESYFDRLGEDLASFLPSMLGGMENSARWPAAKLKIDQWVSERRYLSQILRHQRFGNKVDVALVKRALTYAAEEENDRAVLYAAETCAARSEEIPPEEIGAMFSSVVSYFKSKNSTVWADAIWANIARGSLVESLTAEQIDLALSALVACRNVDHHVEYVLASIAKRFPEKVIDFFGARLRERDEDDVVEHYEAVPYSLTTLGKYLTASRTYLLTQCEAWHQQNPEFFEFRGGRLFTVVVPVFTPELETLFRDMLASGNKSAPRFIADLLRGYQGNPTTHELYKLIVDAVPEADPALASVEVGLLATGVVSGEFGMVQAWQQKKAEFQPWLTDSRPRVKACAVAHDRELDRMIAAEQRRSEEDLEARKRQFGDGIGDAGRDP